MTGFVNYEALLGMDGIWAMSWCRLLSIMAFISFSF